MKKQLKSFGCAIKGFCGAVCDEGHLRFHLVAAVYVLVFSLFYHFSAAQTAVLVILIASVIAAELFNTAIENVCDLVTKERSYYVRLAKDISAAAVLVLSIAAIAVAVVFFWNAAALAAMFGFFAANPLLAALLLLSAVFAVIFVVTGPGKIRERISKKRKPKG